MIYIHNSLSYGVTLAEKNTKRYVDVSIGQKRLNRFF